MFVFYFCQAQYEKNIHTGAAQYFFRCLTYDALKLLGAQVSLQLVYRATVFPKLRIQIGIGSLFQTFIFISNQKKYIYRTFLYGR